MVVIIVKKILNWVVVLNNSKNGFCNNGLKLIIVLILINKSKGNNFVLIFILNKIWNGFVFLFVLSIFELGKLIKIVFSFIGISKVGLYFFFIFRYISMLLMIIIIKCLGFVVILVIFLINVFINFIFFF